MYLNVDCILIKTTIVVINSEDFDNISRYLFSNVYPIHILESKNGKIFKEIFLNKMIISTLVGTILY